MEQNPMAKYDLANRYGGQGGKKRGQEGGFQNTGNQARDARRAALREQAPPTFAQMQEEGMARPAPPPVASGVQMFTGNAASAYGGPRTATPSPTSPAAQQAAAGGTPTRSAQNRPSTDTRPPLPTNFGLSGTGGGSTAVYDRLRASAMDNLRASFAGQRQSLNEDLARRGLWASSGELGAGARLGDLAGQQGRAEADLESNLLAGEREAEQRYMQMMIDLARYFQTGGPSGAGGL